MYKVKAFLKEWQKLFIIFILSISAPLIFFHFIRTPLVDGDSMLPTYHNNDRIVVLNTHEVERNDIAVIWCDSLNEYIIKRVIGIQGDRIDIKRDGLYRNGNKIYESYINDQNWTKRTSESTIIVPDNCIFVLGDNRDNSMDSRAFGAFDKSDIIGKVIHDKILF